MLRNGSAVGVCVRSIADSTGSSILAAWTTRTKRRNDRRNAILHLGIRDPLAVDGSAFPNHRPIVSAVFLSGRGTDVLFKRSAAPHQNRILAAADSVRAEPALEPHQSAKAFA